MRDCFRKDQTASFEDLNICRILLDTDTGWARLNPHYQKESLSDRLFIACGQAAVPLRYRQAMLLWCVTQINACAGE